MIGRQVSHYKIIDSLGSGGMGVVYRAEDVRLGRMVGVKFLPEQYFERPAAKERFKREARAASALNHPNICTLHDVGEYEGQPFIVMELLEGETLKRHIGGRPLPVDEVLELAIQISDGLEVAHAEGIIHRDLKPSNIYVTPRGQAKILDFGLAKRLADTDSLSAADSSPDDDTRSALKDASAQDEITEAGHAVGTAPYMAPEQALGHDVDARADLFSFCAVLYEMATGQRAFPGSSPATIFDAILNKTPASPSLLNHLVPAGLAQVIEKGLEKDRALRYQSAADLRADLKRLRRDSSASASRPGTRGEGLADVLSRAGDTTMRMPRWVAAAVGAGGLALALGIWSERDPARESSEPGLTRGSEAFDAKDWIIAVMPTRTAFAEQPELAMVNEGLTLTLTAKLAQLSRGHDLQVIPASALRDAGVDSLKKARQELGVTLALTFDTHPVGDGIRVNAQLVDTVRNRQISAETIDGDPDDLLTLEERVTNRVLRMLRLELRPMEDWVLKVGTSNPRAHNYYLRGRGYLQNYHDLESVESAVTLFEQALRVDPEYAMAHAGLGEALWERYKHTKEQRWIDVARQECEEAVALEDLVAEGHVCLGTLFNGTGQYERAIAEFELAKSADPSRDQTYRGLADAYLARGQNQLAEETYKEAISVRPHYWAGYNWLGLFYFHQGRSHEASSSWEEVVRLAPDSHRGFSNLGAAYYYSDDWDRARRAYGRALEIKPEDDFATSNLGILHFFSGEFTEAVRLFERAVALNDTDSLNWGNLADAYYWSGSKREEAADAYRRARSLALDELDVNPMDSALLSDVAYYAGMLGSDSEARELIGRALQLPSADELVYYRAAQVFVALGRTEEAKTYLIRSIERGHPKHEVRRDPLLAELSRAPAIEALLEAEAGREPASSP